MTDKAYIVANKKQELDVLKKFEAKGLVWLSGDDPTELVLSENSLFSSHASFPYALVEKENNKISWILILQLTDEEIVYDGRKEDEEVYTRYKVTQEFMNELVEWRDENDLDAKTGSDYAFVVWDNIQNIPYVIGIWWTDPDNTIENNNRLIAIIQWLNGEDVFEVEAPHKFVVRSNDIDEDGDYWYVQLYKGLSNGAYNFGSATKFDTR